MRQKQFKVRIENTESGDVTELATNCLALVTADQAEGDDQHKHDINNLYAGHCAKSEMIALAEALGKAEREMQKRILHAFDISFGEFLKHIEEADE